MKNSWAAKLWAAQRTFTYLINGREYRRIPYGRESRDREFASLPCHDCEARRGQFHVPGCDMERCPACRGQLISCRCEKNLDIKEWTV